MRKFIVRSLLEHTRDADNVEFEKEFNAIDKETAIELATENAKMMVDDLKTEFDDEGTFVIKVTSCEEVA